MALRHIIKQVSRMQLNHVALSSYSSLHRFGAGKPFSPLLGTINSLRPPTQTTMTSSFHSTSYKQEIIKKDKPSNKMLVHRNIRDYKRRLLVAKYELRRNLYKALCRDPELPSHVRERHRIKLSKLPRNSSSTRVRNRCIFTGRDRGVYEKFRMSRIVFRELASRGELMGVKKASW